MQDFPSNSQKAQATDAPREKLAPVTSATTRGRKRGLGRRFKEVFIAGSAKEAGISMVEDVIVPTLRSMVIEALQSGVENLFNGDRSSGTRRSRSAITNVSPGHVNYGGYSNPNKSTEVRTVSRKSRARHDFDDIIIDNRNAAEEVLDQMFEQLSRFGRVSVADLYELTGIRSEHTDVKWGWTSLRGSKVVPLRSGGYLLNLPEPDPLG